MAYISKKARQTAKEKLVWLVSDPVRFTKGLLCHKTWTIQEQILKSVAKNKLTAVKACNASSKTFTAAEAALWWVIRYPNNGIVITTAPTDTQVRKLLWGEIHKAIRDGRIVFPSINQKELSLGPDNYAMGMATNEGVRFHGFHGKVLVIFDEAPGIRSDIWDALEGIRAGGDVHVLALGNPLVPSGHFYDIFTNGRGQWKTFSISALDTPNFEGINICDYHMQKKDDERLCTKKCLLQLSHEDIGRSKFPYLITRYFALDRYKEWGPKHPFFEARVLGQFPKQSEDALIALAYLEEAKIRPTRKQKDQKVDVGIDVAGPGEAETVVWVRCGPNFIAARVWTIGDPRGEVKAYLKRWEGMINSVNVDSVGIGWYFAKDLKDSDFPVQFINVGLPARDSEKFANLKAEAFWAVRMRFQGGDICGLEDELTISQLASIRYKHNARGQVVIESKDELARRGVKSPDRAEALMLAYIEPPSTQSPMAIGEGPGTYFGQTDPDWSGDYDEDEDEDGVNEEATYLDPSW